jgi:carboxyl-terminal processing protease
MPLPVFASAIGAWSTWCPLTSVPARWELNSARRPGAQVLAGALQDNRRALVAGERTFGKGLIQTVVALSDGVRRGLAHASRLCTSSCPARQSAACSERLQERSSCKWTFMNHYAGSAVAVTVSRYQTPAGVDINKKGIQPDIEIPDGSLPSPGAEGGFCKALTASDAPSLFK